MKSMNAICSLLIGTSLCVMLQGSAGATQVLNQGMALEWSKSAYGMMLGNNLLVSPEEDTLHDCAPGCDYPSPSEVSYTVTNSTPYAMDVLIEQEITEGGSAFLTLNGSSGDLAVSMGPWQSETVIAAVEAESLASGLYRTTLHFTDQDSGETLGRGHTLELGVPHLVVTPENNHWGSGPLGGPFPQTRLYKARSVGPSPIPLRVSADVPWVTVNGQAGPYNIEVPANGGYANIHIGFGGTADDLPAGLFTGVVTFENTSSAGDGTTTRLAHIDVARNNYVATDVPLDLPDLTVVTSEIEVTDIYCVADVDVAVDITHDDISELQVSLVSPFGTTVYLHSQTGDGVNDLVRTYDDDGEGTLPSGPGALHDFYPEEATGTWKLEIRDVAAGTTGTLNSWTLMIASTGDVCPPTCEDVELEIEQNETVDIQLVANSFYDYSLSYIITSLPCNATLRDSNGNTIDTVPHTMPGESGVVTYDPNSSFIGTDDFTYKVNDGTSSEEADVSLIVGFAPSMDDCADAFTIGNGSWDFSTSGANTDGPQDDDCQFDGQTYHDIWYRYVACQDGTLVVSTCNSASYDTDLVVYDGDDCNNLVLLGCNDDGSDENGTCSGYSSYLEVPVTMDQAYLVRVGGWNDGDQGNGTLTLAGPEGDCNCDGGDDVPECPGDATGDGLADVNDVLAILSAYGTNDPNADLDGNGVVDVGDILLLLQYYGEC